MLSDNEIATIQGYKKSYADFGLKPNLHVDIPMPPFAANDQQIATVQAVHGDAIKTGSLSLDTLNPQELIKVSGVSTIDPFVEINGAAFTITMTLELLFDGFTLAIPRWSLYEVNAGVATEIISVSNDYRELNVVRTWQKTRGVGGVANMKHIVQIATANVSGGDKTLMFKGDWLYIGKLIKAG